MNYDDLPYQVYGQDVTLAYTAGQMRDYAAAKVAAERERCCRVVCVQAGDDAAIARRTVLAIRAGDDFFQVDDTALLP